MSLPLLLASTSPRRSRLLQELGMTGNDLFKSRSELIADAYFRRGQSIAYSASPSATMERQHKAGQ